LTRESNCDKKLTFQGLFVFTKSADDGEPVVDAAFAVLEEDVAGDVGLHARRKDEFQCVLRKHKMEIQAFLSFVESYVPSTYKFSLMFGKEIGDFLAEKIHDSAFKENRLFPSPKRAPKW
jgi:hypothetical protein